MSDQREQALHLVSKNAFQLKALPLGLQSDHAIVKAAVAQDGNALQFAAQELKDDKVIVLAAVKNDGSALRFATDRLQADREVVLAAVASNGLGLQWASEELRADRDAVSQAVAENTSAFRYASDALLEDETFEVETRLESYVFRIAALSGSCCTVTYAEFEPIRRWDLLARACEKLQIPASASITLLHGTEVVPNKDDVTLWPGPPSPGSVIEYQLVVQATSTGTFS
mmetsp:Transcript_6330/g.15226  ORF Transcript_6330/g.15226 Transcript_6330/m.15226 type:complete len:228 (+) Transcript_6330:91-774(+)